MSGLTKHKIWIAILITATFVFAGLFLSTSSELKKYLEEFDEEEPTRYLRSEEAVIINHPPRSIPEEISSFEEEGNFPEESEEGGRSEEAREELQILAVEPVLFEYIEVGDGCDHNFQGECLNVRSGPGEDFPIVSRLRNGAILKVGGEVERDGRTWYKIVFDEWLRYPDRVTSDWYVAADFVEVLLDEGVVVLGEGQKPAGDKRIVVSRNEQKLRAWQGQELFMEEDISTGLELSPTPRGTFTVFRKTPSRYMQGPIPGISSRYWDLPGVPWNLYFTHQGAIIHGAYWHDDFGNRASAGCVNVTPDKARELYYWADIGTTVVVQD